MHAIKVSHKILDKACPSMHSARRHALATVVCAAINGRRLSVTGLGRAIDSEAMEKHSIKRADRLVGNTHLYHEIQGLYQATTHLIIGFVKRPIILIDWSDLDSCKRHFLLRASVAVDGRALSLYEEVHTLATKEKPASHRAFMNKLKRMLPDKCKPIIVTDAGFRTPWFILIESLGWDWVGRLRNRHLLRANTNEAWFDAKKLYNKASTTPRYLGEMQMTRNSPLTCHFVAYKNKPKGRGQYTSHGERSLSTVSQKCAKREREPWLLVTSLSVTSSLAKRVVKIYSTRMQIEEAFRDMKSIRYGIGFELNLTRSTERLQILILIAMLASLVLWILGMAAIISEKHFHYQANSIKDRRVLSVIYLGLRVAADRRFKFRKCQLHQLIHILHQTIKFHGNGW